MKLIIDIPESILDTIDDDLVLSREQLIVLQKHITEGKPYEEGITFDYVHGYVDALNEDGKYKARPQGEWIPVSERLPEEEGFYLVSLENGQIIVAHSSGLIANHDFEPKMLAWQPLPEPYKKCGAEMKIKQISPDSGIREFDKKFADLLVFNDQPQRQLKSSDVHEDVSGSRS